MWYEFVGNIEADAAPVDPAIEHVAGMLIAARTRLALIADAAAPSQTQRAQRGRPEIGGLCAATSSRATSAGDSLLGFRIMYMCHRAHTYVSSEPSKV